MKIKSIRWNGRVVDTIYMGQNNGSRYVTDDAVVSDDGISFENIHETRVEKIEEITTTVYEIHYNTNGNKSKIRIFNPIEVYYEN